MDYAVLLFAVFPAVWTASCSLNKEWKAPEVDVLILGAGITGVTAARTLEVNGITDFLILEAGDRIGGRIREDDATGVELEANWIHGLDLRDRLHHPIWREWTACDEDGPDGSPTPFSFSHVYNSSGGEYDIWDKHGVYLQRKAVFDRAYRNASHLEKILTKDISLREGLTEEGWIPKTPLDNFIEWAICDFEDAISPNDISLHFQYFDETEYSFLGPEPNATAVDYLVSDKKGYSFVTECLARNFKDRVKLNSVVTSVYIAEDCVCATVGDSSHFCGRYGLLTFPIGAMHAAINQEEGSVRFIPPLPDWKQDAIRNATPVYYGKVHLFFTTPFWNTSGEQEIFGYASNERGRYAYYILDRLSPNMITVDVTEELAVRVSNQSEKQTVEEVMVILRKIFGQNIQEPYNASFSKWSTDPLFRCAYTAYKTGVPDTVFHSLLKPVNTSLYFAGESMNASYVGYTHSGYGSGAYVAHQIARLLSPQSSRVDMPDLVLAVIISLAVVMFIVILLWILGGYIRAKETHGSRRYSSL